MADRVLSDAMPGIHDEGLPNITDGNEDWGSAGLRMMLGQAVNSDSYVRSDSELTFTNHDGTNDQVDVTGGTAYLDLTGETVNVQSSLGGSSPPAYDATLASLPAIPVHVFSTVADLNVQDSTLSDVWLAYATDGGVSGISAGDVYLRSDDTGSVTAPPHPSVRLGQANPDDASADVLLNRFGSPTFETVTTQTVNYNDADEDPVSVDPATGTVDIDLAESNWYQPIAATENITISFSNVSAAGNSLYLYFTDGDNGGPYTITYPASVEENGGSVTKEIANGGNLAHSLTSADGGTTWQLRSAGADFA